MDRRLKAISGKSIKTQRSYIDIPMGACINGYNYNISLGFLDTCAIQGAIPLKDLYSNTSINTGTKELIQNYAKKNMLDVYINDQQRFIKYALGDLKVYDAFQNHNQLLKQIYKELGLAKYFKGSCLTIGTTVSELFTASIRSNLGLNKTALMQELAKGSVQEFLACKNKTAVYLTKTNGGRCFNNKPFSVSSKGIYTRVDIKGCYGNSLRNQLYPIGSPVVIQYPRSSKNNHYMSLREVLSIVRHELVDGLWMFRVSTEKDYLLKYKNDMLMSWYPPENLSDLAKSDTDYQGEDNIHQNDHTRFYSSEVHLAPITYAELEWIEKVCSQSQKNEYLDKLMVISGVYYPKSKRVDNYKEYQKTTSHVSKGNTWEIKENNNQLEIIETGRENNAWFTINIADLILDKLAKLREKYPKDNPESNQ
uniref:Uncharacterized protein n=1 Tax=Pyropia pulchra TaxID=60925 RepID=O24672_9RHOD|nr:ORF5 [Pyropia pulchra]